MEMTPRVLPPLNRRRFDDHSLVLQAVNGSQSAFDKLFQRHNAAIFHYIYKKNKNPEEARKLTLEAFGKAFTKLHLYAPNFAFSTWLFRIANNHYIDFVRKSKSGRQGESPLDLEVASNLKGAQLNPEELMESNDRNALVLTLLQLLHPRYRHILELRFFEELSYDEMAEQLSLPVGTVKTQLFRAKEMMRELLEGKRGIL